MRLTASPALLRQCLVATLVLLTACGGCRRTDAQRAAEERAKIEEQLRTSYVLFPYRAFKLTLRAHGEPGAPEAVETLWKLLEETRQLPESSASPEQARQAAEAYLRLAVAFYKAKKTMETRDEDEFPLLWTRWTRESPPWSGYDTGQEHLLLGAAWLVLDVAERGNRVAASDMVFYELSRATPRPEWPAALRTAARAGRGLSFCEAGYHYAAEEELGGYLAEVEALPEESLLPLEQARGEPWRSREGMLAAGYFLRAWNRMGLEREDAAADDVERGLQSLQALGVENELTWWGWAFIHSRRGRYEQAAEQLDTLALSPHLDAKARQDIQASAQDMRQHGKGLPVFLQTQASLLLVQALVARAGGLEKLLTRVLGEETARQVYSPLAWMDQVRTGLGEAGARATQQAQGLLQEAREVGARGWEALVKRQGGSSAADAGQAVPGEASAPSH